MCDDPPLIAKSPSAVFASIRLYTILEPLLDRLSSSAIGAKVPVF